MNDTLEEMIDEAIVCLLCTARGKETFTTCRIEAAIRHLKRELVNRLVNRTLSLPDAERAIEQFKYRK